VVLANLGLRRRVAAQATYAWLALVLAALFVVGGLDWLAAVGGLTPRSAPRAQEAGLGLGLVVTAALAAVPLIPSVRLRLARLLDIDPASPVHALALSLGLLVLGFNLALQLSSDVLAQTASSSTQLTPADLVGQEIPFLLAAFLGVGLLVRRPFPAALQRLGLVRPTWWQIALALAAAGLFYAFGNGVDYLSQTFTPDLAHKVDAANQRLFGKLDNPTGIVTLAVAAGICEEVLFRGALQPRLGIVATSVLFASVHTQYGLSFDVAGVLVLSIGLGLLRRFANTTTSATCHVAYDLLVGVGVGATLLPWALAGELAIVGLLVAAYVRYGRALRPQPTRAS
jgi:membrane protease YdiL (CAAX protease family)